MQVIKHKSVMNSSKILIVGSGAQGRIVLDILRAQGQQHQIEFVDDNRDLWGKEINGIRVGGGLEYAFEQDREHCEVIVAIGRPLRRMDLVDRLRARGVRFLNAIHPTAVIAPSAAVGVGNTLSAGAIVNTDARLGDHILINTGVIVEHDCVVSHGTSLSPGVILGGRVRIEQRAFLGLRALVQPILKIGKDAVIAAGSVVTMDVPDQVLVAGVPARMLARVDESFDWSRAL